MILDLTGVSGIAIGVDPSSGRLQLGDGVRSAEPRARLLGDLRELLAGPDPGPDNRPCYWMYGDVRRDVDTPYLGRLGIRYDVTVTLPGTIGGELMKTAGHYHRLIPNRVATYPEIYEVLSGEGLFLLQRVRDPRADLAEVEVEDVLLVRAGPGDRLLIPSHHGHVTINPGSDPLVVADLIATASENHYGAIREARGAAYYVLAASPGFQVQQNPAYRRLPAVRVFDSPSAAGLDLDGAPMYQALLEDPERFAFLGEPSQSIDGSSPIPREKV